MRQALDPAVRIGRRLAISRDQKREAILSLPADIRFLNADHVSQLDEIRRLGEPCRRVDLNKRVAPRESIELVHLPIDRPDCILGRLKAEVLAQVALAMAAAYAYHLAENQCFIDGNKRTAVLTALYFLELNGVNTSPLANEELYDAMISIAEKRVDKAGLATIFRRRLPKQ